MGAMPISISKAPSQQCAADASLAVWEHTELPATRYRQTHRCLIYGKKARPPHIAAVTFLAVKPVPTGTAWCIVAHAYKQLAQGRYLTVPQLRVKPATSGLAYKFDTLLLHHRPLTTRNLQF